MRFLTKFLTYFSENPQTSLHQCKKGQKVTILQGGDPNSKARAYEMAVRYNYSTEELTQLVDCISMIKSLAALMLRAETGISPWLRLYMHHRVQQLVQGDLLKALHRADKRQRDILSTLLSLRRMLADWQNGLRAHCLRCWLAGWLYD